MAAETALSALRAADPAAQLAPLGERERLMLREAAVSVARNPGGRRKPSRRYVVRIVVALAVLAVFTTATAWAAGVFSSPTARQLFRTNPQGTLIAGTGRKGIWDQKAIPGTVRKVASVEIPRVGRVAFWYARANQGGWCGALRLSNGDWLGLPSVHDKGVQGGGTVPGCFATSSQMHHARQASVANGFDCVQNVIDARDLGELWQIRYGRITAPGAVRVRDLVSGASSHVIHGNLFILAIRHPPRHLRILRPVAYDAAGKVVARGCPGFGGH